MQRLIHRVWLGPAEPLAEHDYSAAWERTNPGWQLVTWTDANVGELDLVCRDAYDRAPTYVHRADIILVEAVHALGGVAVGYDVEPLRPIDKLIVGHAAWCTPDADGFPGQAFFGAAEPGHPAFRAVLNRLEPRLDERGGFLQPDTPGGFPGPHVDTGPYLWGDVFGRFGERAADYGLHILGTWMTAYPVRYWEHGKLDPTEEARRLRHATVAHRFAGSWLKDPEGVKVR